MASFIRFPSFKRMLTFDKLSGKDFNYDVQRGLDKDRKIKVTNPQSTRVNGMLKGRYIPKDDETLQENDIDSTAIESFEYDPKSSILTIWFKGGDGAGYDFPDVPKRVVEQFIAAPSKGEFYNQVITNYSVNIGRGQE